MKTLTDFRKTVETGVDPRLLQKRSQKMPLHQDKQDKLDKFLFLPKQKQKPQKINRRVMTSQCETSS